MNLVRNTRAASRRVTALTRSRGFTLIELMVVVVIIGVLAALIVPNVLDRLGESRVTAARSDVAGYEGQLQLYKLDNGQYPTTEQGLESLAVKPTSGPIPPNWRPYIDKVKPDPWGHPYQYAFPGLKNANKFDIYSFGADGVLGGEGENAEIGNW